LRGTTITPRIGHLRREGEIGETVVVGRIERMEVRRKER
jgi:hypothetical protein